MVVVIIWLAWQFKKTLFVDYGNLSTRERYHAAFNMKQIKNVYFFL